MYGLWIMAEVWQGVGFTVWGKIDIIVIMVYIFWFMDWRVEWTAYETNRGSHSRLIASCITQLEAQGPSTTCNESKEEEVGGVKDGPF